jgi:hypothetical protein
LTRFDGEQLGLVFSEKLVGFEGEWELEELVFLVSGYYKGWEL